MILRRPRTRPSYARRRYSVARRQFLQRNAPVLAALGAGAVLLAWVQHLLMDGYLLGVMHGLILATYVCAVMTSFHLVTGAGRLLAGAWGEENSQDLLRRAKRKGLIWGWVDNLEVASGDVDHLVLTRDGAWIALDSKWHSGAALRYGLSDIWSARASAQRARNILRSLRHPRPLVTPVVVVWGGGQHELTESWLEVEDVAVVKGRALVDWLSQRRTGDALDRATARRMLRELRQFHQEVNPSTVSRGPDGAGTRHRARAARTD